MPRAMSKHLQVLKWQLLVFCNSKKSGEVKTLPDFLFFFIKVYDLRKSAKCKGEPEIWGPLQDTAKGDTR